MSGKIKSIVFVCLGNICRSPMCESIMTYLLKQNKMDYINVYSMGTSMEEYGNPIHSGTRKVLFEHNIPIIPHRAEQIRESDYNKYDLIIGLDHSNIKNLYRIFGGDPSNKIKLLLSFSGLDRDVQDPWWTGNFDATFDDCILGCNSLIEYIKNL